MQFRIGKQGKMTSTKAGGIVFIILAVVLALMAAGTVLLVGKKLEPSQPVVVISENVRRGDILGPHNTRMAKLPPAGLPKDIITSQDHLSKALAGHDMLADDIVRESALLRLDTPLSAGQVLAARVQGLENSKLRAVDVPIEAVGGMLGGMQAGDRVDVVAVQRDDDAEQGTITETIIEAAPVVGVSKPSDSGSGALVVALTPEQCRVFAAAREQGTIYVALLPLK